MPEAKSKGEDPRKDQEPDVAPMKEAVDRAILTLLGKIVQQTPAQDALQFSQAALNVAQTKATLEEVEV